MNGSTKKLIGLLAVLTAVRLAMIGAVDLIPDEAYYWSWSTHLSVCYFDQPGGIAWGNALFTAIFGTTTFGVRMGAIVLGLLGTVMVYLAARRLSLDAREASIACALLHVVPLFAAGHIIFLHDTVLFFAASVALYFFARAAFDDRRQYWLAFGASLALAMYGKFSAVIFALGFVVFLVVSSTDRKAFLVPFAWLGAALGVVLFLPVLFWNSRHEWVALYAVRHLVRKEASGIGDRVVWFFDFWGSQIGLVTPILFVMMLIAVWSALKIVRQKNPTRDERAMLFLAVSFSVVFLYFMMQSLGAKVQGNWPALAYLPGTLLLVRTWSLRAAAGSANWRRFFRWGVGLAVVATVVVMIQPLVRIIPLKPDITDQVYGWKELAARVDEIRNENPEIVLVARRYQIGSELMFYCKGQPEIYSLNYGSRGNQFDLWNDWTVLQGRTLLFVDERKVPLPMWDHVGSFDLLPSFERKRDDRTVGTVRLTLLRGFHIDGPMESYFRNPLHYTVERMKKNLGE